jgi:2,4-dichlorophenol 6-monooxygenase
MDSLERHASMPVMNDTSAASRPNNGVDVDVLVVGLGPMGGTLALARMGVSVRAITMFPWVANTPRAHIVSQRAMEVMRDLDLEDPIHAVGTPWELIGDCIIATSLTGVELARMPSWGVGDERHGDYVRHSPCTYLDVPQPRMEPIIVGGAAAHGAHVEFNTELISLVQHADHVEATLRNRASGVEEVVRCRYLVGADGARSRVAEQIGLPIVGHTARSGHVYTEFKADLSHLVKHRPSILHYFFNPEVGYGEIGLGLLRAVTPWNEWIAGWGFDPAAGDPDMSVEAVSAKIRLLIGDPDIPLEVTRSAPWYVNQQYATTYSVGRVFCGGDATHRHPPSSGLGLNTSVQDAHNLAWKLAYVIKGDAGPELLASYSDERAPIGKQIVLRANQSRYDFQAVRDCFVTDRPGGDPVQNALTNLLAPTADGVALRARLDKALRLKDTEWNAEGVEKNARYISSAVVSDGDGPPRESSEVFHHPTTDPGAKLPHAWLIDERGHRLSTLDVVGRGRFTVVTGVAGLAWGEAVERIGESWLGIAAIGSLGMQDPYASWARCREIEEAGALLVRPDGYVAWRHTEAVWDGEQAYALLSDALARVLGRRLSGATDAVRGSELLLDSVEVSR